MADGQDVAASTTQPSDGSALYHLVQEPLWQAARSAGQPYCPPTYAQDGFTHLTKDPGFLLGIGNHFYKAVPGNFLLLVLDPSKLSAKVVFEPAAAVGGTSAAGLTGGEAEADAPLFPHLYGTIDFGAVQQELLVQRGDDGTFLGIPGLEP